MRSGGWLLYDSTWPLDARADPARRDLPRRFRSSEMCNDALRRRARADPDEEHRLRRRAGRRCSNIDSGVLSAMLNEKFAKKAALLDSNQAALRSGYDYASEHFACPLPIRLAPMDATKDAILIDGNTAAALGCLYAGATVGAWYPITPATSLMEAFKGFCQKYRREPGDQPEPLCHPPGGGRARGDRHGRSARRWAGARAFTPTSGPGISLMNEFIGLAYYAEIPAVIFDVQRTGPSTGMPTRTQQGDLMMCAYASHGDTKHICSSRPIRAKRSSSRCRRSTWPSASRRRCSCSRDLDIGMNDWMMPAPARGTTAIAPTAARCSARRSSTRSRRFHRYVDRGRRRHRLPHAAGRAPERRVLHARLGPQQASAPTPRMPTSTGGRRPARSQDPARRARRAGAGHHACARAPRSASSPSAAATPPCVEALDLLAAEGHRGRLHARPRLPVRRRGRAFLESHETIFVVEQNRDAQLRTLLLLETGVPIEKLESVRYYGGFPLSAHHVVDRR